MAISINFEKQSKPKKNITGTRIIDVLDNKIWFKRNYWDINVIERNELINSLEIKDEEKIILNDIVIDIEELVKVNLENDKVGFIPYLGRFKLSSGIRNLERHREEIKKANASGMSKEELKKLTIEIYTEGIKQENKINDEERIYRNFKKIYKKEYNRLYQDLGKTYAEMFIWTLTLLRPIEFDAEFQRAFEKANNL